MKLYTIRRSFLCHRRYSTQFKKYEKLQNIPNRKCEGEDEYIKKWKPLSSRVEPYSYRFFSHYCGNTPNIVPEDIGHLYIEEVLNPLRYRAVYSDKNLFPEILGRESCPLTILCRVNGSEILDGNFNIIRSDIDNYLLGVQELILKPSIDSSSGRGIIKFTKSRGAYVSVDDGVCLTSDFLLNYSKDFCLQEAVRQHEFMNRLCPTSVNTIRLGVYRSVSNESVNVLASIIRVGKDGSFVDNAHAGGMFVGVNVKTGVLGKFVIDQYGNKKDIWNGLDYTKEQLVVPNWSEVISFAKKVGGKIHHHRLIAMDIALDEFCSPKLIEYNIGSFSYWLFQYTGQEVFGEFTDEIINHCKSKRDIENYLNL